jgi:translation initiation factor 4E
VTSFKTVEDFWKVFNNLTVPSSLPQGSDYHLFKKGIEPEWEHEKHIGGGAWTYRTQSKDPNQQIDYIWFQVLLSLIGNTFEKGDYVTGVVVSARKSSNRIAIWGTNMDPRGETNNCVGRQFKSFVEQQTNRKITYQPFDATHGPQKQNTVEL